MTMYMSAIILTEVMMLTMTFHVLYYPGFTRVEKRWYICTFLAIFFCAGAEFIAIHFNEHGSAFVIPLTILTVIQFSLSPMLPAFFVGALGMYRHAIVAGTFFCIHVLIEIVSAPFGWIFRFDAGGKYIRGQYYTIYEAFFFISLIFLIVSLLVVGSRFKRRDIYTIFMVLLIMAASLLPLVVFKVYTDYLGIGLCASLSFIYYNDLNQEDSLTKIVADQKKMFRMQEHTISGMANLIESRDISTGERVRRTGQNAGMLAECAVRDGVYADKLDDRFISELRMMAPMYDIGKIVVPDHILKKPGKVTDDEFEQIKRHTSEGGRIIREVLSGVTDEEYVDMASDLATYHHERWDGRGYPSGLSGESIPLSARIMAIADVYDALISERCYKKPVSKEKAFEIIRQESGSHFDPNLADVFLNHKEVF